MPIEHNNRELEYIIETSCIDGNPLIAYKKNKKVHIQLDMFCVFLSCIMLLISTVFMCINIHYMNILTDKVHQETEVIVEIVESTPAPGNTTDILPNTEETIHIEETAQATVETEPEPIPEVTEALVTPEPEPVIDPNELEMLACVIYQEAGGNGSCDDCRRYVADIVLNRVEDPRFPDTMEEVLTSKGQYGRFYWTGIKWAERAKYDTEQEAVARAYRIAEEVLSGQHSELYGEGYIWQAAHVQGTDGFWCCGHYYGRS